MSRSKKYHRDHNQPRNISMVNITEKQETHREAIARGTVKISRETLELIKQNRIPKGDVFTSAKLAGIIAAKKTAELIPLCHPLPITHIDLKLNFLYESSEIEIISIIRTRAATGVEMEALTAVAIAGLTIYDMCNQIDPEMILENIRLIKKTGDKSSELKV
jgi:cyclic pyranopterin monophosphate synthase